MLKARKTDAQYKIELDEAAAQIAELRAEVVSLLNDNDAKQQVVAQLESRVAVRDSMRIRIAAGTALTAPHASPRLCTPQMHETSEYKALQKKANVRLAKAAQDLAATRDRERAARNTIQQVTEQLLVSER